jgi:hypothetical protein
MSRKRRPAPSRRTTLAERTPATQAEELEALALQYPQDREEILIEAAGCWGEAGQYERALALYQQLLETGGEEPHLIEAYRISTLWDAGRVDQAREAALRLRHAHPTHAGAWNLIAETFETAGELQGAAEWFTAGLTHLLGPATPLVRTAVENAPDSSGIEMLVIGRHRVRRLLSQPHDNADHLADELHEHRPTLLRGPGSLDDLHDPDRLRAVESGDPDILQAELEKLTAEVAARHAALSRPRMTCALFWPEPEFSPLTHAVAHAGRPLRHRAPRAPPPRRGAPAPPVRERRSASGHRPGHRGRLRGLHPRGGPAPARRGHPSRLRRRPRRPRPGPGMAPTPQQPLLVRLVPQVQEMLRQPRPDLTPTTPLSPHQDLEGVLQ